MAARAASTAGLLVLVAIACSRSDPTAGAAKPPATHATERAGEAWFVDATGHSRVDFVHVAGATPEKHLPETMGAGAALADLDEDGDLDLYLVQGGPMPKGGDAPGVFVAAERTLPSNRVYRNDGALAFTDVTDASGDAADRHYGMGVAAGDADGDGHLDLYLTNLGPDVLLAGDGKLHFADRTRASGIADDRWTTGAAFFDADDDGDLDLFVTGYVLVDLAHPVWCGDRRPGWRSVCHPDRYPALGDRYWTNKGNGTFEDATIAAGLADDSGKGLCVAPFDADGDGDLDLYVANDSTENRLWLNRGEGAFDDGTLLSGTGADRYGRTEASMGVAIGDVDGDLDLDLFVTGFDDESDTLYEYTGDGVFEDRTVEHGLESATRLPVGFGTVLADFDQDGDLDLAITNGHIVDNIELYHDGKTHAQAGLLFANDGAGKYTDVSARGGALTSPARVGRGLFSGDLDGDLDLDLVVTQCGGPAAILENRAARGGALSVSGLPYGTRVIVTTDAGRRIVREAGPAPSYLGQCAPDAHFGLGNARATSIAVRVPGESERTFALAPSLANARIRFTREHGELSIAASEVARARDDR